MRDIKIPPMSYETMTTLTNFATVSTSQDFESANTCAILPATMRLSDYSLAGKLELSIVNQGANSRAP